MTTVVQLLLGAGALGTIVAGLWGLYWKNRATKAETATKSAEDRAAQLDSNLKQAQKDHDGDVVRLEAVITNLKRELALLEENTSAHQDPDAVRLALQRLLSLPTGDADGASAVVVPP